MMKRREHEKCLMSDNRVTWNDYIFQLAFGISNVNIRCWIEITIRVFILKFSFSVSLKCSIDGDELLIIQFKDSQKSSKDQIMFVAYKFYTLKLSVISAKKNVCVTQNTIVITCLIIFVINFNIYVMRNKLIVFLTHYYNFRLLLD
jgi:hypothetical protein